MRIFNLIEQEQKGRFFLLRCFREKIFHFGIRVRCHLSRYTLVLQIWHQLIQLPLIHMLNHNPILLGFSNNGLR
ncbi:hypothetical protein D3C87_2116440 [compost metagenome]